MGKLRILFILVIGYLLLHWFKVIKPSYVFKVNTVKEIAQKESGYSYSHYSIRQAFRKRYPDYVLQEQDFPFLPSHTGGLDGSVSVLYASLHEFLVLYNAEIETTGSTGRHYMNISVSVLKGTISISQDGITPQVSYSKGENHVLRMGTTSTVKLSGGTTLLVYGRGIMPLTAGYWVSDSIFSHNDPILAVTTIWLYLKAVLLSNIWVKNAFVYLWTISSEGIVKLWQDVLYHLNHLPQLFNNLKEYLFELVNRVSDWLTD
ncbi:sigma non-opioid intracellular receptor 1-like [Ciona intestinalis]